MTLRLGHICKAWRAFVLSTPALWSSIQVEFPQDIGEDKALRLSAILTMWMERSGEDDLKIQITMYPTLSVGIDDPPQSCSLGIQVVFAPLVANCHRWRDIHVNTTFLALKCLVGNNPSMSALFAPRLASFALDGDESGSEDFDDGTVVPAQSIIKFSAAPCLRKVTLSEIGLLAADTSAFPWQGVEDLILSGIFHDLSFDECATVLRQCLALKHCSLSTSLTTRIDCSLDHTVQPIILHSLESLDVTEHSPPDEGKKEIYGYIVCMDLQELTLRYVLRDYLEIHTHTSYWIRDSIMAFLDMSPRLTKLHLWSLPLDEACLIEVLNAIPCLTHLTVISWRPVHSVGNHVLHELSLKSSLGDFVLVKDLAYLRLESHACSEAFVIAFIASRRNATAVRLNELFLNFLGSVPTDTLLSRLDRYVKQGLCLAIDER
ncbi:hypothetical protein Hypma_005823 [Hypsizygus marmoreus]|uniref:F-box domain-containing protein n=1 Tax=Hypsizygus marmoreus TaxID=39966 RepID=A0A369KIR6_HYPMA|nr:hypothetical protein Hypma_005823 [Hypsizygus marmoreus]